MSAKVMWRLADTGKQAVYGVQTEVPISLKCTVAHCISALKASLSTFLRADDDSCMSGNGKPVAFVTITFLESEDKISAIISTDEGTYSPMLHERKLILAVFYMMYGWAESNGIHVDLDKCVKPSYVEHV